MQPQNRPRGESVELSRSEAIKLADAFDPILARYPSRTRAAQDLGLSEGQLYRATCRKASIRMTREALAELGRVAGIDVSRFGA